MPIHILGVNQMGLELGNSTITEGRELPWLQENTEQNVWWEWHVNYRDVVVLDTNNVRLTAYNLTEHDLAIAENFEALETLLLDAAAAAAP